MAVIETYGAVVWCPEEGCFFAFRVENCTTEEEGRKMLAYVARLHGRLRHGSSTHFEAKVYTIDQREYLSGTKPN
jgi:hypothetical protein